MSRFSFSLVLGCLMVFHGAPLNAYADDEASLEKRIEKKSAVNLKKDARKLEAAQETKKKPPKKVPPKKRQPHVHK